MGRPKNLRGQIEKGQLYTEFIAERDEIRRHKYFMSQSADHDVGFEAALVDWVTSHREDWVATRGEN